MMLSRSIRVMTSRSTTMLQQRRTQKKMSLTFAGANNVFYAKTTALQIDVPTFSGNFGILAEHVPIIAVLKPGLVTVIEQGGNSKNFFVSSGSVSVLADSSVQVLAEEAWELKDLDYNAANELIKKYIAKLAMKTTDKERAKVEIAIKCAISLHYVLEHAHLM